MKIVWNICDKELGGEIKSVNENYFKSSLEYFRKSLSFREIYGKYLEKNKSVGIAYSYSYTTQLWNQMPVIQIRFNYKHSINW